jgi:oligopeptide transport system substrate-binding protein
VITATTRFSAILLLSLVLPGCDDAAKRADLVFINSAEIETPDPAVASDQVSMRISESLFEGLCRNNFKGEASPGMAERWDVSDDKKRYTFHLRSGILWSNGDPVTAQDFVRSWERALRPGTASDYAPQLYPLVNARAYNEGTLTDFGQVGVKALDERTLEATLENPIPYWIDLCAFLTLAPVHMPTLEKHGDSWIKPGKLVGNGPYLFESWLIDDHIRLRKNPRYWDAANVRMEVVDVIPIAEANTALNYFFTNQADLMMDKGMLHPSIIPKIKQQPWFHTGPFLGTWFVRANVTKPPFNDARVRLAFSYALDRKRIVEKITQLGERTAFSMTPPGTGQNFQPPAGVTFDAARAKALLAEAGFPEGRGFPRVSYLYLPLPIERNIAVELQAMWRDVLGVTVSLEKKEQKIWLSSMRELSYDLCRSSWVGDYNDPNTFLEIFITGHGQNRTGWASKQFDGFIAAAAAEADVAKRHAIFSEAEKLLTSTEAPVFPVYHYVGVQFRRPGLKGVEANLIDNHPFRAMWWEGK